jgi:hypothetical protein
MLNPRAILKGCWRRLAPLTPLSVRMSLRFLVKRFLTKPAAPLPPADAALALEGLLREVRRLHQRLDQIDERRDSSRNAA